MARFKEGDSVMLLDRVSRARLDANPCDPYAYTALRVVEVRDEFGYELLRLYPDPLGIGGDWAAECFIPAGGPW